ncbi:MAG: amino acid racemase [Actinobacteria bacterium]|nr:amino acid racemase [Actinomycetota bacterium]MCB9412470.1 amino acid racemase [Actinomycetota bacterium]
MRTIGLLGGMSWESSAHYYRLLNEGVRDRLGGLHSARVVMHSVDFAELESAMRADDWETVADHMVRAARSVEAGGGECLLIGTNTGHKVADRIADAIAIPVIHLIDVIADEALRLGLDRVGLLGTSYTMEQSFYRDRLATHGLRTVVPDQAGREEVNRIIFEELVRGVFRAESRSRLAEIVDEMQLGGVILGCTELELLLDDDDVACHLLPSTRLHVQAGLEWALH